MAWLSLLVFHHYDSSRNACKALTTQCSQTSGVWACLWWRWPSVTIPFLPPIPKTCYPSLLMMPWRNTWKLLGLARHWKVVVLLCLLLFAIGVTTFHFSAFGRMSCFCPNLCYCCHDHYFKLVIGSLQWYVFSTDVISNKCCRHGSGVFV